MIEGKTQSGFEFCVSESVLKSWAFLEAFTKTQSDDIIKQTTGAVEMVNVLLPPDQKKRLLAHLAGGKTEVSADRVAKEVGEIIKICKLYDDNIKK